MRAVGYRQLWRYLSGEIMLDAAVTDAVNATRRLAKRQLTWLRSERADCIVDPWIGDPPLTGLLQAADAFLTGRARSERVVE